MTKRSPTQKQLTALKIGRGILAEKRKREKKLTINYRGGGAEIGEVTRGIINRATSTILENKYEILFNLALVRNNARPAFLLESSNFTDIKPKILFDTVRALYPYFKYAVQNTLADGTPHRMFIYLPETQIGKYNNDRDIGRILGFHCRGLPNPDMVTWLSNYKLVINGVGEFNIYTEVCPEEYDIDIQKAKFNEVAESIGGVLVHEWYERVPNKIWLKAVLNNGAIDNNSKWLINHKEQFKDYMEGSGIEFLNDIDIPALLRDQYYLLLFVQIFIQYDPFDKANIYPVSNTDDVLLQREMKAHLLDKTTTIDIIKGYKAFIEVPGIKKLYNSGKSKRLFFEASKDMISKYEAALKEKASPKKKASPRRLLSRSQGYRSVFA